MHPLVLAGALAAAILAAAGPVHAQAGGPPLPPGDGHDIIAVACTQCHPASVFTRLREGANAWRHQIYDMVLRGAQVTPAEIDPAVSYLTTNFGPGVPVPGPPPAAVALPDGPGKELVEGACGVCHGLDRVAGAKRQPSEWQGIVARMEFFGATLSPDQSKTVVSYLSTEFGAK